MSWRSIKFGEHLPVFTVDCLWQSFSQQQMKQVIENEFRFKKMLKLNGLLYLDSEEYNKLKDILKEQINDGTTKKIMNNYSEKIKRLLIKKKSLTNANIKTKSTPYLDQLFIDTIEEYISILSYFYILQMNDEVYRLELKKALEKELTKKKKQELNLVHSIEIIKQQINNPIYKEKKQLLTIAELITKDERLVKLFLKKEDQIIEQIKRFRKIYTLIKKHNTQYCWINTNVSHSKEYDFDQIIKALKEILLENPQKKSELLKQETELHKKEYNEIKNYFKASKNIIKMIKEFEIFEDKKIQLQQMYYQLQYYLRLFLEEIAKRHNLTYHELTYLTYREILGSIKLNLLNKDIIKNRENDHAIIIEEGNKLKILTGFNILKLKESLNNDDFIMDNNEQ